MTDRHPPVRASRADRRSTPRRLEALAAHEDAHRERLEVRRELAEYTRHTREESAHDGSH